MRKPENAHTKLVNDIICALGERPELGKFWKRNTGKARHMKDETKIIAYGFKGSGDIEGFLNNGFASHVEIEVKTGKGVQSERQINFQTMAEGYGVIYLLARECSAIVRAVEHLNNSEFPKKVWVRAYAGGTVVVIK